MAIIEIPVGEPYGTIPVNTLTIYSAVPHPPAPDTSSDLLIDSSGARSIQALVPINAIGRMLGTDFAEFTMANVARSTCFVNRTTWVSIVPHPQIAGVVQINFTNHYIPVRGTVSEVRQALQSAAKLASAGPIKPPTGGKRKSTKRR
jgi:hypothetical protein